MKIAKSYKCCKCKKQATVFFPVFDPDIPSHPYCDTCVVVAKENLIQEILKIKRE